MVARRGHERSSFSRRAFPKKPVAPVNMITVLAKNASMEFSSMFMCSVLHFSLFSAVGVPILLEVQALLAPISVTE